MKPFTHTHSHSHSIHNCSFTCHMYAQIVSSAFITALLPNANRVRYRNPYVAEQRTGDHARFHVDVRSISQTKREGAQGFRSYAGTDKRVAKKKKKKAVACNVFPNSSLVPCGSSLRISQAAATCRPASPAATSATSPPLGPPSGAPWLVRVSQG